MFQFSPVLLGLFDSAVQKLMNGFRDIFYELAYANLDNMLSDMNERVGTISTQLSTSPEKWQGGTDHRHQGRYDLEGPHQGFRGQGQQDGRHAFRR